MSKNVIDLGTIEFKRVIEEVRIAGKVFEVSAIISAKNTQLFMENIDKGMSPRVAFCTFALEMHSEAQKMKPKATTRRIFNAMNDDEAIEIMQVILCANTDVPQELWKQEIQDIYERFEEYISAYAYFAAKELAEVFNNLVDKITKQIASTWTLGLKELYEKIADVSENMTSSINSSLARLKESAIKYFDRRKELDPVMSEFGWGGLSSIPGDIIRYINANKSELSKTAVNEIMQDYYSYQSYENLEKMMNSWWVNPVFANRKRAIIEIIECYKQNLNIACITLCTIQIEGVIKGFLYERYRKEFSNSTTFQKLADLLANSANKNVAYLHACSLDTLDVLRGRFTEKFYLNRLDEASDFSRNKIAHGQMYEDVSKAEVLKTIFFLDELDRLLCFLSENISE